MGRFSALPSQNELKEMKEDLAFKEGEMKKSEYTTVGLAQGKIQGLSQALDENVTCLKANNCYWKIYSFSRAF